MNTIYSITPVPKPRMTQRDKWQSRATVMRYRAFCDEVRAHQVLFPECGAHITFHIPMPSSWSQRKRKEMLGQPHQQRPDLDNLIKALGDAVHAEDSALWDYRATKVWSETGAIEIKG